jgi:general secretion pathway protein A
MTLYRQTFGLSLDPFNMTPDPGMLFMTEQHREALAGVAYAILDRKGFAVLTGPAGTGKTTLVASVLQSLAVASVQSSVIFNPALSPTEFLEMTLLDFGVTDIPASKAQRIHTLQKLLLDWHQQGKVSTLIIDEAHKLSPEVLEEVRLWSNFEFSDQKLLQIVLVGQPELRDLLNREDLRQLKQRIALRFTISPLSRAEIEGYIQHRWTSCGASAPMPITPEAVDFVARASGGIPRVINAICDNALLLVFGRGLTVVAEQQVRDACIDLDLIPSITPKPVPAEVGSHAESTQTGNGGIPANGALVPAIKVSQLDPPLLPNGTEFPSLRTLGSYDPLRKRSFWNRLLRRNGAGAVGHLL